MNLLLIGLTIGVLGKIMLGIAVLRVHLGILHEHHIDNVVLRSIKREQTVTLIGLLLIVVGYLFEMFFYTGTLSFLCEIAECFIEIAAPAVQ
ncbi:hypothetical protein KTR10_02750 [Candidatus Kaiserbacteria bacterium]|nr:hypothetical protein [Candidatus Kaiserbacteria bacterium]